VPRIAEEVTADFDPLVSDDPQWVRAEFSRLREEAPLSRADAYGGYWALTRYEDVRDAASDSRLFISSVRAVVPSDPRGLRRPPLNFDAPAHTPYRRALDKTLQRRRLERLEPVLRTRAREALAPMLQRGGGDIAEEFGVQFPAWMTTEWLNLDPEVAPILARTSFAWVTAWREQDTATVNVMSERMYDIARDLVARRRREPLDVEVDPASSLLAERVDGEPLGDDQIVGALRQCLVVGMVAPPIILGSIVEHLATDAELQDSLRDDPARIPAAIEEFVRLYSPYRGFSRTVSAPTQLHGRLIQPNEPVTLAYHSANRDPEMFADPDRFIMNRPNIAEHLGFGRGRHRCAGMPLARLGLRIELEELLAATSSFRIDGDVRYARMPEVGLTSAPVRLTTR
jgi:cytochrome P450